MIKLLLTGISGICWTLVYLGIIYRGKKDHVHGMPLFALGLNIAWEWLYGIDGLLIHKANMIPLQVAANCIWGLFDVVILIQYFRYGRHDMPGGHRTERWFIPYSIAALVACVMGQLAFYLHIEDGVLASQYSAFAQNALMSVCFLTAFMRRGDARGQSYTIAVAKMVGTLMPTILGAIVEGPNEYILLTGIICFLFDCSYIYALLHYDRSADSESRVAVF